MNEEEVCNYWSPKRSACRNHQFAWGFYTDAYCSLGTVNPLWEVAVCQPTCCTLWTHGFKFLEVVPSDQCLPLISRWTNCLQLNIWKIQSLLWTWPVTPASQFFSQGMACILVSWEGKKNEDTHFTTCQCLESLILICQKAVMSFLKRN